MAETIEDIAIQVLQLISEGKVFSELDEQITLNSDGFYASINTGTSDAKKIKIPLLRGYNGEWDASTNTPSLANGSGLKGSIYKVSTGAERDLGNGTVTYVAKDLIYNTGDEWVKLTQKATSDIDGLDDEIDFIKDIIRVPPTYVQPTASITDVSQSVEKGTTLTDLDVNISFTQNDAGSANGYSLEQDGVEISTTQNNTVTLSNITSNIAFQGFVSFDEGVLKNDNLGEPYEDTQIDAGTVGSSTRTIIPRLKVFFGSVSTIPTNSSGVRSLPSNQFENSTTLNLSTGTTNKNFAVAIPSTKSIISATDEGNLNLDVTSEYTLRSTFDVQDAGGNLSSYKVYAMTVASAYSTSTNHKIIIG